MSRTQWNDAEDEAMDYLPHLDQIIYLRGIRRRMDYQTGIAGMTAPISYGWLAQLCEVRPRACSTMRPPPRPDKNALRSAFDRLEAAGLIRRIRDHGLKSLVFECLLADRGSSVRNMSHPSATHEPPTKSNPSIASNGAASQGMSHPSATPHELSMSHPIQVSGICKEEAKASLSLVASAPSSSGASSKASPDCPHLEIIGLYHEMLPELPLIVASRWPDSKDAKAMQARWREDKRHQSLDFWERFFDAVRDNAHWMGQNERGWKANLRWLVKRENFDKVLERMVDNTRRGSHMDNQLAAQAEQALLGALLFNNKAWDRVADRVSSGDFAQAAHRVIWDVIADQLGAGNAADPFIVATELERRGKLDLLPGGMSYLGLLHGNTPSAANVVQYAERVRDQSILRQLVGVCSDATEEAQSGEGVPSEILEAAQQRIGAIADQAQRGNGAVRMRDLMSDVLGYLDTIHEKGGSLIGQTTGYADLDRKTSGLQGGDLIILAGRPSMGKSTMAVNIAEHIAIREGRPVMVFSLEMSARSLGLRITSSQTRIDFKRLRHMDLQDHEWAFLTSASHRVGNAPLLIDDAAGLTIGDITARARRAHRELGGLALIVVDYLQLITTRGRVENRNIEVSKISQGLKALAKSLDVPVIALSQLSRAVEQRADKRPMMSDLRDSGGIEQDADLIAFIYRDEVYNSQSQDKGTAELIIAKQRNGETGTVRLCSNLHYCRFDDLDPSWRRPEPEPKPQSFAKRGKGPVYDY